MLLLIIMLDKFKSSFESAPSQKVVGLLKIENIFVSLKLQFHEDVKQLSIIS